MKRIITIFILMFLLVGCSKGNFTSLNYKELTAKLEKKDTFILLVNDGSDNGDFLKDTLNKVLENNDLKAYEFNATKIKESDKNALRNTISFENIGIIFIKDGLDSSKLTHITDVLTSEKVLENHLKNLEFIKK